MSRRIPFPFRDHHDPIVHDGKTNDLVDSLIPQYEDALATEYMSGDLDVASFHEGLRTAYEGVLVEVLGIDQEVMNAYWLDAKQQRHPQPYADELPLLSDPDNWLITYEQVEEWSSRRLNAEQWDLLNEAIPDSPVAEAITAIVATITDNLED